MTLFLNILFVVVSVLYMTGRLYEISTITDTATNFLTANPVVTSPLMLLLICVIAVCCGIIIFAQDKHNKKIRQMPVGIFGIMAGLFFVIGGIVNSANCFKYGGFILYHGMEILGGAGLAMLGAINIKGDKKEMAPVVLTLLIPIGTCMNSVLHEIKPISDTDFLMRSIAGIATLLFFMLLYKMAYKPDKTTKQLLYIAALINFVFTGIASLAAVLGSIMTATVNLPQLLYNVGYIFVGLYSVFIAFFITPDKVETSGKNAKEAKLQPKPAPIPVVKQPEAKPTETDNYYNFGATGNIDKAAIEELFARKDSGESLPKQPVFQTEEKTTTIEKIPAVETTAVIDKGEPTARIYIPEKHREKSAPAKKATEKTTFIPAVKEKSVFKGGHKNEAKDTPKKTVYKAKK